MANFLTKFLPTTLFRAKAPKSLMPANQFSGFPLQNWFSGFAKSGEQVSEKNAKQLATYYACIRNIAEDISKLPYIVVKTEKNGNKTRVNNLNVAKILQVKPNNYSTPIGLKYSIINDAIARGNGYALIIRDKAGLATEMHYIDGNFVYPEFDIDTKSMFYQINYTPLGLSGVYSSEDIFHLKGPGNSMVGKSVLAYQLETLGHALAIQNYSSKYFSGGASMSGILTFEGVSDEKKLRQYTEMFMASYTGGSIAAMPSGVKFEAMGNDPQKSQFVETENYMRGEIARWFRMPLSKLQDLSDTNNSALEQVNINYVTDCLMPWIVRFEQEADQKLYAIYERDIYDGYIDTDVLLRGDSAAMERKIRTMFTSGAITPNEVRKMYAINTIDEDYANSSYMPSNMMPGETAIPFWTAQADKNLQLTNSQPGMGGAQQ